VAVDIKKAPQYAVWLKHRFFSDSNYTTIYNGISKQIFKTKRASA
jgi:hypothetical protein